MGIHEDMAHALERQEEADLLLAWSAALEEERITFDEFRARKEEDGRPKGLPKHVRFA